MHRFLKLLLQFPYIFCIDEKVYSKFRFIYSFQLFIGEFSIMLGKVFSVSVFELLDILLVFAAEAPEEPSSPNAGFIQLMIQAEISSINLFTSYRFLKQKCGCECKVAIASDHTVSSELKL